MPTIIALDVSLSMTRCVTDEEFQRKHLAVSGINTLLDHIGSHLKLEFVSLVVFSYLWEQLVPFTRDVDTVRAALNEVTDYSKTCLEPVLGGISGLVIGEWSTVTPCQVILITDGCSGVGPSSLKQILHTWEQSKGENSACPLPFPFKAKLHVIVIANPNESELKTSLPLYDRLIKLSGNGGEIFVPDGSLTMNTVNSTFSKLVEAYYTPYKGVLKCGNLKCHVTLIPKPDPYQRHQDYEETVWTVSSVMSICGFMDLQDIASPPTLSRHLMLPIPSKEKQVTDNKNGDEEEETPDEGKTASFTVLLHGSLKVEGMVAITRVAENWYGMLYSWADSKKKSSLMLSLFEPGADAVSWIGSINQLAPISDFTESPFGEDDNNTPYPVRPKDKRSYAQSCVVWIKAIGLQADLQKVIRHARKLPDKQQHFYKELNRIRKAALSFGFTDLLEAIAGMLERECTMLSGNAHPDAALQLTHAATALCSDMAKDSTQIITPLRTNFAQEDS